MKKLLLTLTALALIFATACSQGKTYTLFSGSYWLSSPEQSGVSEVNETCEYSLTYVAPEKAAAISVNVSGTLITKLTKSEYEGVACYKFQTDLSVSGSYVYGDKTEAIDDSVVSVCYLSGLSDKLAPLYSEKTVTSVTPMQAGESYSFVKTGYKVTSKYDIKNNVATVNYVPDDETKDKFGLTEVEREYKKYSANYYFDNESLLFFPRACDLEAGFSHSFTTIDALGQKLRTMSMSVSSETPTKTFKLEDYTYNGLPLGTAETPKEISAYAVTISISDTFSGSPIKLMYAADAKDSPVNNRKRLISMETELPYSLGKMVYTVKKVQSN